MSYHKSIHFLARPYTLLALGIYFINEFILQPYFPSWVSGKLSDFAWLFLFPVLFLLMLSLLLPTRNVTHQRRFVWLAYGFSALSFTAIKTVPVAHDAFINLLPFHASIALDPSDLLALLVLPLSYRLYMHNPDQPARIHWRAAWVLPVFALLTLADAPAPVSGVIDLLVQQDYIIARTDHEGYFCSKDGGINWQDCSSTSIDFNTTIEYKYDNKIVIPNSDVQYRITETGMIDISQDNGRNWKSIYSRNYISDVKEYYQLQNRPSAVIMKPGAQDTLYDPKSGNILFAMGLEGIIAIQQDSLPKAISVGDNHPVNLSNPVIFFGMMFPFALLSGGIIIIFTGTFFLFKKGVFYWLLLLFSLGCWGFLAYTFYDLGYISIVFIVMTIVSVLLLFGLFIDQYEMIKNNNQINWNEYGYLPFAGGISYFFCYILWYINVIPKYQTAVLSSFVIVIMWFFYFIFKSYQLMTTLREYNESKTKDT